MKTVLSLVFLMQRKPHEADCTDPRPVDEPSPFDQLRRRAGEQPEPQRLLFVFAAAALPDDASPAERDRFAAGVGGTLAPVICVDKAPDELTNFDALVAESRSIGRAVQSGNAGQAEEADETSAVRAGWQVVFAAGLSGRNGQAPSAGQITQALEAMVERVRNATFGAFLALDRSGKTLRFI